MKSFYEKVLSSTAVDFLNRCPASILDEFYLAGGTALALQLGHRYSDDLDFFCERPFNNQHLKNSLAEVDTINVFQERQGTLEGELLAVRLTS